MEHDAAVQLPATRPHDLVERGEPEGDEEQAGLVDVPVVTVDDVDLGLVGAETATQAVGDHRAARAAAEDDDPLPAHDAPPLTGASIRSVNSKPVSSERRSGQARATFSNRSI